MRCSAPDPERWAGMRKRMRDCTKQIRENWPTIMQAWEAQGEKCPVIECDLANKKVRAYASGEYIDSLSERTRETTRREFARAIDEGGIMVFVLDTKNRVLKSYSFPGVGKAIKRKPNKPSHRIANAPRVGNTVNGNVRGTQLRFETK